MVALKRKNTYTKHNDEWVARVEERYPAPGRKVVLHKKNHAHNHVILIEQVGEQKAYTGNYGKILKREATLWTFREATIEEIQGAVEPDLEQDLSELCDA